MVHKGLSLTVFKAKYNVSLSYMFFSNFIYETTGSDILLCYSHVEIELSGTQGIITVELLCLAFSVARLKI